MVSREIKICNTVGLHARPATFFIQKANSFRSTIWIERDERRVDAKSLLGVLSMGVKKDTVVTLIADGSDEEAAVDSLCNLIENELEK
ncbi:MAG: HPr family phosphocarrier protein [Ruminococcaceae bacterium]|nr:HPr family phosphocarrier protein [Oscillospiraceae bacterium]